MNCPRCSGCMYESRIPFQLHYEWTCINCGNSLLGAYAEAPARLRALDREETAQGGRKAVRPVLEDRGAKKGVRGVPGRARPGRPQEKKGVRAAKGKAV